MCGMSLRSHSQHTLALGGTAPGGEGQLVRLWCGSDAVQKQKPYTLESIHPRCLLSIEADTHQACLFLQTAALAWVCVMSFSWYCNGYMYIFDVMYCKGENPSGTEEVSVFSHMHDLWHHFL